MSVSGGNGIFAFLANVLIKKHPEKKELILIYWLYPEQKFASRRTSIRNNRMGAQ